MHEENLPLGKPRAYPISLVRTEGSMFHTFLCDFSSIGWMQFLEKYFITINRRLIGYETHIYFDAHL
jgi:hypothetical protein